MGQQVQLEGLDRTGDIRRVRVDNRGSLLSSYDFRDVTATGHASMTSSAESTLVAGDASNFLDLIFVSGSNTSDVAVNVNIRSGTGNANHIDVLTIPANDSRSRTYLPALLSSEKDAAITVEFDDADVSNTTVLMTGLAFRNSETN